MSTRRNQTADLGINSRPLESRFKRKQKTSTTRGHQKCTPAVPTQNSSRHWRKRKLEYYNKVGRNLKLQLATELLTFWKRVILLQSWVASYLVPSCLPLVIMWNNLTFTSEPRFLSLILVSSKRSQCSMKWAGYNLGTGNLKMCLRYLSVKKQRCFLENL